jgi:hypothetical protein
MPPTTRSKAATPKAKAAREEAPAVAAAADPPFQVLTSAPPPWHSVAALGLMTAYFCHYLPSWQVIDEMAVSETFTQVVFPQYMSLQTLALIRATIAVIIWATTIQTVAGGGWVQATSYLPHSKLKQVKNNVTGYKTLTPFTSVSWNLLGVAFTLSSYICLQTVYPNALPAPTPTILRTAILTWQVAAPNTLLVAAVVRYCIWPGVLRATGDTQELQSHRNKLMHNFNAVFALSEIALLGHLPVRWSQVSLAPLLGVWYVVCSWSTTAQWNLPQHGPQFIYFFLDTTLGATTTIAILALLGILLCFYALFVWAEQGLNWMDGAWPLHCLFVAVLSSAVMRFRD